jgi:hypothetical protein
MLWTITRHLKRFARGKHGVSTVIVVMLSLVILAIISANVILWSYQMNQLDWEKMQEKLQISAVNSTTISSSWFVTQSEYIISIGSRVSGTYADTCVAEDGSWERFREELSTPPQKYRLFLNGTFIVDTATYPTATIQTIEILVRYNASDTGEKWHLKAYDWTKLGYSDIGFNDTSGSQPTTPGIWVHYAVNLTNQWNNYVRNDGVIRVQFHDGSPEPPSGTQTEISLDFLGVRVKGNWAHFTFRNESAFTVHIISLWVINSTCHKRYNADFFLNSAQNAVYIQPNVSLPTENFIVKAITERGNTVVFSSH